MLDDKDKNPKKASDTGTKDKNPRTVSETDTLRKRAKIVKEAPTGPEWEKITSDGEEIYVKRAKGSEPDSTSRRIEKKPVDINKVKTKYVGAPPKDKPKKDIEKRKTPPTKMDEDEVVRVVKDEEEPNIPTPPTPTEPTPTPPPASKPTPKQTGLYGSISTYEKIDPAAQWGADYGITTFTFPDAEGRYTNTSRTVNIDKEGNEIAYDLANPLNSFKDGKFTPTLTGRTIEDVRNEWSLAGISKPTDYSGNKANPDYKGSLMMPGTKATRIVGGGGGEFNQRNTANTPSALKGAPTGYIEQKYDSEGKPIFTPNQGVQFNEENVAPLREGEMEVGKMYDIPNTTTTIVPEQNRAKGGKIMAPKVMKKYAQAGVVQVPGSQNQNDTGNVPLTKEEIDAKKKKNDALMSQLGSAAMTIGNQLNQQPIDYSLSEKQRQNADLANVAADQALSATVPYYGLVTGTWDIANSMTAKDKYGEAKPGINAAISEMTTNPIEGAIKEASKGNVLGALRESSGWGKIGRAGMQVIGKGEETKGFFGGVNKALGTTDRKIAGEKYMAEQLAEATAKDAAYKQSQAVANRNADILEGAKVQGLYDLSSPEYDENRQLILKPGYAKGGVIGAAKMRYAKGGTIVGKGGPKDDAIFTKANEKGIAPGSFIVPAENNEKAKGIRAALFGGKNKKAEFKKGGETESNVAVSNGEHLFTPKERKKIINYLGEEILEELAPNAEENSEEMNMGGMLGTMTDKTNMREYVEGGLMKRADGSYSKRGLWDNIRDAAGSGKKPTAEMLKQEKKIKAEYYNGGIIPENVATQKRTEQIQDSYAGGGYVVEASSDREGKTHKVTGPDGTEKYFGDSNLGQHPKDPERKKAFYARHKENLDNNPFFRAYARETWAEGGTTGDGLSKSKAKIMLHEGMAHGKPITEQQRKYFGWVAGGSKESKMDSGKIMAPKMKGYAAGGDVEGTGDGTTPSGLKIAARKNSTGVAEFDKEIDNISKKVYTSAAQLEADAKKLEAIQDKYNAIYGKNSLEISNARQGLFKIKPEVEKKYASIKTSMENSDVVKQGVLALKSIGASEKDINDYKKEITDKKINVGYGAGSTTYGDITDKYLKSVGTRESKKSAVESKKTDIELLKNDASKFYGEKYSESKSKLDDINKNPQNYTVDQISEVKKNYELYTRKLNDVVGAINEGGLKLVRERDLYKDLAKKEGVSVKGDSKLEPTVYAAKTTEAEVAKTTPVETSSQSNKTYEELITPPLTWKGSKEAWKAAADKSIKEGKTVPKDGVSAVTTTASVKAPSVKKVATSKVATLPTATSESGSAYDTRMEREARDAALLSKPTTATTPLAEAITESESARDARMAREAKDAALLETSPKAPKKGLMDYVSRIDPGAAFSAYQIGQGSKLLKSGQRPEDVSKIDPAYNAAVERAQRDATFGYTPEQAAMLDQKAINALNDARFSGRNLAGGSAGTAFQQERQAINQGWSNALQLKSADQQLRMQKQQYADQAVKERADFLDMQRRRAFGDAMNTYNVNQESGSALVGAGVRNAIGAFRYQKELDAQERAAKIAGTPITTG
jgi:hypothetical protein